MKGRKIITAVLIALAAMTAMDQKAYASETDAIEDLIAQYQRETKCGRVSVVVYENGVTTCYGDSASLYQIGSMTKAFTGLAVQKLMNGGAVREDGTVSEYIPGFCAYYDSEQVEITVRDLLEQKSGYTNNEKDYPSGTDAMTLSGWTDSISGRELKCRPGTEYAYSNVNYNLLGSIIEHVTGRSYREYMEQEILIPLGLSHTSVGLPADGSIVEGTRLSYRHAADFPLAVREASIPAGYFYSDTEDMGRWIEIWTGSTVIPEDLAEPLSAVKARLVNEGDYYSGWELFADGVTGHSGGTPNYSSRVVFSEDRQIGVCVLSNLNVAATTDSLCNSIYDTVAGRTPGGLAADIWTVFDLIFTGISAAGILLFAAAFLIRKKVPLIVLDAFLAVLLVLVFILFPVIFGAGMKEILFTWAPWSMTGGLLIIVADIVLLSVRLFRPAGDGSAT